MYVHARKRQFMLDRDLRTCAEDYLLYVHNRKHHFVYHLSPCACVEGCVVYVIALNAGLCTSEVRKYMQ